MRSLRIPGLDPSYSRARLPLRWRRRRASRQSPITRSGHQAITVWGQRARWPRWASACCSPAGQHLGSGNLILVRSSLIPESLSGCLSKDEGLKVSTEILNRASACLVCCSVAPCLRSVQVGIPQLRDSMANGKWLQLQIYSSNLVISCNYQL
jgi:hypothetical protein